MTFQQAKVLDVLDDGNELLVFVGDQVVRLSALGRAIWLSCGAGADLGAVTRDVIAQLGTPPGDGAGIILDALSAMMHSQVLIEAP